MTVVVVIVVMTRMTPPVVFVAAAAVPVVVVVVAQPRPPPATELGHDGHAVVQARCGNAVGHDVAGPAVREVTEALRKLEQRQPGRLVDGRS